jgi:hypothetical protein
MRSILTVMKAASYNVNSIILRKINQTMLLGNSSRPISTQISFKWFWFPSSMERISQTFIKQAVNFLENFCIVFMPVKVVFPSIFSPCESERLRLFLVLCFVVHCGSIPCFGHDQLLAVQ